MLSICYNSRVKSWRNGKNPERIIKIKPYIIKYNWKKNNYEKIYLVHVSKHNRDYVKQVTLLMILHGERWQYLAVKKLSVLLRGMRSKHHCDFYCLNCQT